ncbi:MAG: response regulator [Nanoarchaeota archaeon]
MPTKILIVEDDRFLRELISKKLDAEEEYNVVQAVDGEAAIEKIEEEDPDLVLLDLILPGIDGFEVLSRVKNNPDLMDTPIVVLSNLGQKEEVDKGLELGAIDFLVKAHFTPGEIIKKVKKVLKEEIGEKKEDSKEINDQE